MDRASTSTETETTGETSTPTYTGMNAPTSFDDAELAALLATLRVEAAPEADFEQRFLYDLHERIAREAVCRPARVLLWEHVTQFLANIFRRRRLAFGATACGAFALCSAYFAWTPGEMSEMHAETAPANRFESTLSSLKPGIAKEVTRISVGKPSAARTSASTPSTLRNPVLFADNDETYDSAGYPRTQENLPIPQDSPISMPAIGF